MTIPSRHAAGGASMFSAGRRNRWLVVLRSLGAPWRSQSVEITSSRWMSRARPFAGSAAATASSTANTASASHLDARFTPLAITHTRTWLKLRGTLRPYGEQCNSITVRLSQHAAGGRPNKLKHPLYQASARRIGEPPYRMWVRPKSVYRHGFTNLLGAPA